MKGKENIVRTGVNGQQLSARIMGGFLAGIVLGSAISFLMAPRSGKATRNRIAKQSRKIKDQFYNTLNHSLESLNKQLKQVGLDQPGRKKTKASKKGGKAVHEVGAGGYNSGSRHFSLH